MKLASLKTGSRDGSLVVVSKNLKWHAPAEKIAPTLQAAIDSWSQTQPQLQKLADALEKDEIKKFSFDEKNALSPLPRAYEWVDASAYLNHVRLVRKARNAEPPSTLETDPLVYQGGSSHFLAPHDDVRVKDTAWGYDFESEVAVILNDTRMGTTAAEAQSNIALLLLCNDWSLRNLIPDELAKGFGFFQGKPASAFSPVAVTPDELGNDFREGRIHKKLKTWLNGKQVGDCDAGPEMHFSFLQLIEHISKTRQFCAGTILGSGTVSNVDRAHGVSCLAEQRMIEIIETKSAKTEFLKPNDHIEIDMLDNNGQSIFGRISQKLVAL